MATQLSDPWAPPPACVCDFSWYGVGGTPFGHLSYVVNGVVYPPAGAKYAIPITPLNTVVTFDAGDGDGNNQFGDAAPSIRTPPGFEITSYAWDLGNGATGTGPQISTTFHYTRPPPDAAATLTIVDSSGRSYTTTHPLNLQPLKPIYGSFGRTYG